MMKTETCIQSQFFGEIDQAKKVGLSVIIGVWVNGKTYWMKPGADKLILEEGITLLLQQNIVEDKVRLYNVELSNQSKCPISTKLLIQHRYHQLDNSHLSFISPSENVVFHLAGDLVHLANGNIDDGKIKRICTVQPLWNIYSNKIWDCPESGTIQYRPMAKGQVASLFIYDFKSIGKGTYRGKSWVISGENETELIKLNEALLKTH